MTSVISYFIVFSFFCLNAVVDVTLTFAVVDLITV